MERPTSTGIPLPPNLVNEIQAKQRARKQREADLFTSTPFRSNVANPMPYPRGQNNKCARNGDDRNHDGIKVALRACKCERD